MAFLYDGYVPALNKRFEEELSKIEAHHNFEYGAEFEIALCKVLRKALPHKCGVCRGFVVDAMGNLAGDDIIIYNRAHFPTLRGLEDEDYSRHERIPIEAVYGYIEAKHTIQLAGEGDSSLSHAISQLQKVKALCETRKPVPFSQITKNLPLGDGLIVVNSPPEFPLTLNPAFTMLIARRVQERKGTEIISDGLAIGNALLGRELANDKQPDAIVLGTNLIVLPVIPNPTVAHPKFVSPFFVAGKSTYTAFANAGMTFGVGLCLLLAALDWIQLGPMGWNDIITNACSAQST
jgi:hypothetical protein